MSVPASTVSSRTKSTEVLEEIEHVLRDGYGLLITFNNLSTYINTGAVDLIKHETDPTDPSKTIIYKPLRKEHAPPTIQQYGVLKQYIKSASLKPLIGSELFLANIIGRLLLHQISTPRKTEIITLLGLQQGDLDLTPTETTDLKKLIKHKSMTDFIKNPYKIIELPKIKKITNAITYSDIAKKTPRTISPTSSDSDVKAYIEILQLLLVTERPREHDHGNENIVTAKNLETKYREKGEIVMITPSEYASYGKKDHLEEVKTYYTKKELNPPEDLIGSTDDNHDDH